MSQKVKCKFGVVKEIWLDEKTVVLVHSPAFTETAIKRQQELDVIRLNTVRLNTGVKEEEEEAEKLLELCFSS